MSDNVVTKDLVVGMHYTLRGENGEVVESSSGLPAFLYLHGHGQIVPGLERAMEGKSSGEKFSVEVAAEDGYGPYVEEASMTFPRSEFPEGASFEVGNEFELVSEDQQVIPARITAVDEQSVTLDTNHPLAGKKLFFEIEIASVRPATAEELEHGHVHNDGGHHHE